MSPHSSPDAHTPRRRKSTRGHHHHHRREDTSPAEESQPSPSNANGNATVTGDPNLLSPAAAERPTPASASARQELTLEELEQLARKNVRRSTYGPDFLREIAKQQHQQGGGQQRFSIVEGPEAESIMESYLGCAPSQSVYMRTWN